MTSIAIRGPIELPDTNLDLDLPEDGLSRRLRQRIAGCTDPAERRRLWRASFQQQRRGDLAPGSHLFMRRRYAKLPTYAHHGLFLGDGWVAHYSGEPLERARSRIQIDRLEVFADGDEVQVQDSPLIFAPEEACARALSRYGEGLYNLATNNCEHFVNWCRSDQELSQQVRTAAKVTIGAGVTALFLYGVKTITDTQRR